MARRQELKRKHMAVAASHRHLNHDLNHNTGSALSPVASAPANEPALTLKNQGHKNDASPHAAACRRSC
jgi:hypothetical protein